MGQQQLLLLLLAAIIVGIAVYTGIVLFEKEALVFEEDAVTQTMIEIGESAQAWYEKPAMMGGGARSFKNISFNKIPCPGELFTNSRSNNCTANDGKHQFILSPEKNLLKITGIIDVGTHKYFGGLTVYPDSISRTGWVMIN